MGKEFGRMAKSKDGQPGERLEVVRGVLDRDFQALAGMKLGEGRLATSWRARGWLEKSWDGSQVEARFSVPWLPIPNR